MGLLLPVHTFSLLSHLTIILLSSPSARAAPDFTQYVYRGCAGQKFQDPSQVYSQNLKSLLDSLTPQSSNATFASNTVGDSQSAISGLFQCRGDLNNGDCSTCVNKAADLFEKMCGRAIAARIQLGGCYMRYEISGVQQVSGTELLYKLCYMRYEISGVQQVSGTELLYKLCESNRAGGAEFAGRRETAFETVEKGVVGNSKGFYSANFESVSALGQCEGDLGSGDCGDCVKSALERAKALCGDSVSGQVYLQKCFVSYSYYPYGVPTKTSSGTGMSIEKTVAIAVGGTAGLGFVLVCLLFARSVLKRK